MRTGDRTSRTARRVARVGLLALATSVAAAARPVLAQEAPRTVAARVTYVTSRTVYVDAGTRAGLREGARLEIVRGGAAVAVLRAASLSPGRAACEIVSASVAIVVGDTARFAPEMAVPAPASLDSAVPPPASAEGREPRAESRGLGAESRPGAARRVRGRLGVRYLVVAQRDSGSARLAQPAADVRLDAAAIGGTRLGLAVDARGRRTVSTRAGGGSAAVGRTHVYQAALSWNARGTGPHVTVGRQFAEALANVSLFDGVTLEVQQRRWGVGLFGGTQPDPASLGLSGRVREAGGWVQLHARPGAAHRWTLSGGAVGSYESGQIDRELLFAQAVYSGRRLDAYVVQEVDHNRGWKAEAGERALEPTSTFASVRLRVSDALSLHAGADSRRNVRLYRDRVTPEVEFDDRFRRGAWGARRCGWPASSASASTRAPATGPAAAPTPTPPPSAPPGSLRSPSAPARAARASPPRVARGGCTRPRSAAARGRHCRSR